VPPLPTSFVPSPITYHGHQQSSSWCPDPRRPDADLHGGIKQDCVIELFDYSAVRARMTNDPRASKREPWVKVRWTNIGGISWDVIKAVSIKYSKWLPHFIHLNTSSWLFISDLHPLALEDVFHTRSQTHSKADYFSTQLFLRILCHEIGEEGTGIHDQCCRWLHPQHPPFFIPGSIHERRPSR
jgi:hypothetical protein